jgi:hypothetical protein
MAEIPNGFAWVVGDGPVDDSCIHDCVEDVEVRPGRRLSDLVGQELGNPLQDIRHGDGTDRPVAEERIVVVTQACVKVTLVFE